MLRNLLCSHTMACSRTFDAHVRRVIFGKIRCILGTVCENLLLSFGDCLWEFTVEIYRGHDYTWRSQHDLECRIQELNLMASERQSPESLSTKPVVHPDTYDELTHAVEQLTAQVEGLQQEAVGRGLPNTTTTGSRPFRGECWTCRQRGHCSWDCPCCEQTGN